MAFYDASDETDARYGSDNYCPIYEGERLNCEECGECYEEAIEQLLTQGDLDNGTVSKHKRYNISTFICN